MSPSISTTVRNLWKKMASKEYRDSYVAGHISNTVASQILMLREARGWTQKDLAEKAGMGQSRISALEDPNYENIQVGTLRRLASAFDVGLTVRFVPFSEVATWTAELSTEKLLVPDFANDSAAFTTHSSQNLGANYTVYIDPSNAFSLLANCSNMSLAPYWPVGSTGMNYGVGVAQTPTGTVRSSFAVVHTMDQPRKPSFPQNSSGQVAHG